MDKIAAYKGIAPGIILARLLTNKGLSQRELADKTGIHYQTINAIITGKRAMTIDQTLELDRVLGFDSGFFAIIQTYHQVEQALTAPPPTHQPPVIRKCVFWDINIDTLNWTRHKDFILARIHERGNPSEIEAVDKYYNA